MSFKENLKTELFYQNIQLKEFAGKIQIPYSTILSYVSSRSSLPRVDIAYKIAKELNVSIEYLITGKQELKLKNSLYFSYKELLSLPPDIVNLIQSEIHKYYELYKLNQKR